jgi:hypothetical protein
MGWVIEALKVVLLVTTVSNIQLQA